MSDTLEVFKKAWNKISGDEFSDDLARISLRAAVHGNEEIQAFIDDWDDDHSTTIHVYPLNDLSEHDTDGGECFCSPTVVQAPPGIRSGDYISVHHSLDGREAHE